MTEEQQIIEDGDLRKYRTEIPNMADDDLDPFEYRLYAHYKRVCGANGGTCYQSVGTTAEITQISTGHIVDTRHRLAEKGYIEIHKADDTQFVIITIVDRWLENLLRYAPIADLERQGITVRGTNGHSYSETKKDHDQSSSDFDQDRSSDSSRTLPSPTADSDLLQIARADERNPFAIWEDEGFGSLTQHTSQRLGDWIDSYGEESVKVALLSGVDNNVKKASYIDAALRRMFGEPTSREVRERAAQRQSWERAAEQAEEDEEIRRMIVTYPAAQGPVRVLPLLADGRDPRDVWESVFGQLQNVLSGAGDSFDTHVRRLRLLDFEDRNGLAMFTLGADHPASVQVLKLRLINPISRVFSVIVGSAVHIKFVLASEFGNEQESS